MSQIIAVTPRNSFTPPDIASQPSTRIGTVLAIRCGQLACSSGAHSLLWVDVPASTVHRFTPGRGDATLEVPQPVSAAIPRSRGGLVLHLAEGIALFDASGERRTWLVYWAREGVRGAAAAVDSKG